jgi:type II secretory ATPase GspE/PulE/Tfp pilus assembly ATPase PilB-like protein
MTQDKAAEKTRGDEDALRGEMVRFFRQFGLLLSSGVPVLESLTILKAELRRDELRAAVSEVMADVQAGKTVSVALAKRPAFFSNGLVAIVRSGEISGQLDKLCLRAADGLESGAIPVGNPPGVTHEQQPPPSAPAEARGPDVAAQLNEIILRAVESRASDIHFEPVENGGQVRLRVDGAMQTPTPLDRNAYDAIISRVKILCGLDTAEKRRPMDGRMLINLKGRKLDLRVSFLPMALGAAVTLRVLDAQAVMLDLDKMGASEEDAATLRSWTQQPNGLYLATGPTGSGKTTLLYALLKEAARPERKVLSAENPVEFLLPGVLQAEMRPNLGLTFPALLRSFLRMDPDVIMLGEIRDRDALQILVQAVLTGHLVLSTLHTNCAAAAPQRLIDIGIEPYLVADTLRGVAAMRLVRKVCADCKTPSRPELPEPLLAGLSDGDALRRGEYVRGKGCDRCRGTGYRGRMAIFEILPVTPSLRALIARAAPVREVEAEALRSGMATLRHDGLRKAAKGLTSVEEVMQVTLE